MGKKKTSKIQVNTFPNGLSMQLIKWGAEHVLRNFFPNAVLLNCAIDTIFQVHNCRTWSHCGPSLAMTIKILIHRGLKFLLPHNCWSCGLSAATSKEDQFYASTFIRIAHMILK